MEGIHIIAIRRQPSFFHRMFFGEPFNEKGVADRCIIFGEPFNEKSVADWFISGPYQQKLQIVLVSRNFLFLFPVLFLYRCSTIRVI